MFQDLAGFEVISEENISGCNITMDKAFTWEVVQALSHLYAIGQKHMGNTTLYLLIRAGGKQKKSVV